MASRFASNLALLIAGFLLVCATLGFAAPVAGRVGLGLGVFAGVAVLLAFPVRGRGQLQRCIDAAAMLAAAWTIVAACVFAGASARWILFGDGALLAAIGLAGLIAHEVVLELALRRPRRPVPASVPAVAASEHDGRRSPVGVAL